MCAECSDKHTRGIAPQTHEIIMLGAHCPLLLTNKNGKNDDCVKSKPPKASKPVDMKKQLNKIER